MTLKEYEKKLKSLSEKEYEEFRVNFGEALLPAIDGYVKDFIENS